MARWVGVYNTGTATVAAGGTTVTIAGAGNLQALVSVGDTFRWNGLEVRIIDIPTGSTLTLLQGWPGAALNASPYEIAFTPYDSGYREGVQEILDRFGSGTGIIGNIAGESPVNSSLMGFDASGAFVQRDINSIGLQDPNGNLTKIAGESPVNSSLMGFDVTGQFVQRQIQAFMNDFLLSDNSQTARTNLGVTSIGQQLVTAATQAAGRSAIGAGTGTPPVSSVGVNGYYTQFQDGTQILYTSANFPAHAMSTGANIEVPFQASFASAALYRASVIPRTAADNTGNQIGVGQLSRNGLRFTRSAGSITLQSYAYSTALDQPVVVDIIAYGRYF